MITIIMENVEEKRGPAPRRALFNQIGTREGRCLNIPKVKSFNLLMLLPFKTKLFQRR